MRRIRGKGPDATIQSDHERVAAPLNDLRADRWNERPRFISHAAASLGGRMRPASAERDMPAARARFAEAVLSAVTDGDWQTVTSRF